MNKLLGVWFAVSIGFAGICVAQETKSIYSPQPIWVGSRMESIGAQNPAVAYDLNAMFINPASVGNLDAMPLTLTSKRILDTFESNVINGSFQYESPIILQKGRAKQNIALGWGYANLGSFKNQETLFDGSIRQIGQYGSGFDMVYFSGATDLREIYGFDLLLMGVGAKMMRVYAKDESKSGFGIDGGVIGMHAVKEWFIDRVYLGIALHNVLSTPLSNANGESVYMPIQAFLGTRVDMFDDQLSLFVNNGIDGFTVGSEYQLQHNMFLRGSTNFKQFSLGTGLALDHIAGGIGEEDYGVRFDMNYTQNLFPFESEPNMTFSISILGESKPQTPQIYNPAAELTTREKTVRLTGTGPKNTTMRIYTNGSITRTVEADRYGNWSYPKYPLKEGKNTVTVKSYSIESQGSNFSEPVLITSDTKPPSQNVTVYPDSGQLVFDVDAPEELESVEGLFLERRLQFTKEGELWRAKTALPKSFVSGATAPTDMTNVTIQSTDKAGNKTKADPYPFFVAVELPKDKYVHYRDEIRVIGRVSKLVKQVLVGEKAAYIDAQNNFSAPLKLKPGKNMVPIKIITTNDHEVTFKNKVLRLVTFPDLESGRVREKREIEFLATLGVLEGDSDGNFYPNQPVTRRYIIRTIVKNRKIPLEKVDQQLFADVSAADPDAGYIQAAIQNGLAFAYADGTFKPDRQLTLSEALFMLANAGIIDETQGTTDDRQFVLRKDLAQYLAYTPRFEVQIEKLIDWDRGYQ